jgi:hypothetical protein
MLIEIDATPLAQIPAITAATIHKNVPPPNSAKITTSAIAARLNR